MLLITWSLFLGDVSRKHKCLCLLLETEVNVYVSYFHCRTDDHRLYIHFPTTGILDMSFVDTCCLVGTVHLHKYWLLVLFPSTKAKGIIGIVYLASRDFLLQVRMFVKYTSRVNSMTLIHLVSCAVHSCWRVSQIHHSWNADWETSSWIVKGPIPVLYVSGNGQVILDTFVYSMSFGRGVHRNRENDWILQCLSKGIALECKT
jgi:hypothetical protein